MSVTRGKRFLNDVLGEVRCARCRKSGQRGHHLSRLMAEKMFHHLGDFPWFFRVDSG